MPKEHKKPNEMLCIKGIINVKSHDVRWSLLKKNNNVLCVVWVNYPVWTTKQTLTRVITNDWYCDLQLGFDLVFLLNKLKSMFKFHLIQICGPTIPKKCKSVTTFNGMCFISENSVFKPPIPSSLRGKYDEQRRVFFLCPHAVKEFSFILM